MMNDQETALLRDCFDPGKKTPVSVESLEQGYGKLKFGLDLLGGEAIRIAGKTFDSGFGTHAPSRIRITCGKKIRSFSAFCGMAQNRDTKAWADDSPLFTFSVFAGGKLFAERDGLDYYKGSEIKADFPDGTYAIDLVITSPNGNSRTHAAWGNTLLVLDDGTKVDPSLRSSGLEKNFPVSFRYGEKSSEAFFRENPLEIREEEKAGVLSRHCSASDGCLKISVEMTLRSDFPVWEWHTSFENVSGKRSLPVSNVKVLRGSTVAYSSTDLVRITGPGYKSTSRAMHGDAFLVETIPCNEPKEIRFSCGDGRPSFEYLPCTDVTDGKSNLRIVTGWAGNWCADFKVGEDSIDLSFGLTDFDSYLEPGEKVTMPSCYFQHTLTGGRERASNVWRRFVTKYIIPHKNASPAQAPVCIAHWGGMGIDYQMRALDMLEKNRIPYDVFWIDAGWYAPRSPDEYSPVWYAHTGDWVFNKETYPDELRDLAQRLHASGKKLLLWVEPERAVATSDFAKTHPEWLIRVNDNALLLDLGIPEALAYCKKTVSDLIRRNKLDWYREDFNMPTREAWRKQDKPGRKGMTEVRFVEGLYDFWKSLHDEFPDLMIDNCSSGGCRLDPELLRYSYPLWFSDLNCSPVYDVEYTIQASAGMSSYWPVFGGGTGNLKNKDSYRFRASLNGTLNVNYGYTEKMVDEAESYPSDWLRKQLEDYYSFRSCFNADSYVLSYSGAHTTGAWAVLQYDSPEEGRGILELFRSAESIVTQMNLFPKALDDTSLYEVSDAEGLFEKFVKTGAELKKNGFELRLDVPYSSDIVYYRKITCLRSHTSASPEM